MALVATVATVATRHDLLDGPNITYTDGPGRFLFEGSVVVDTHMTPSDSRGIDLGIDHIIRA